MSGEVPLSMAELGLEEEELEDGNPNKTPAAETDQNAQPLPPEALNDSDPGGSPSDSESGSAGGSGGIDQIKMSQGAGKHSPSGPAGKGGGGPILDVKDLEGLAKGFEEASGLEVKGGQ